MENVLFHYFPTALAFHQPFGLPSRVHRVNFWGHTHGKVSRLQAIPATVARAGTAIPDGSPNLRTPISGLHRLKVSAPNPLHRRRIENKFPLMHHARHVA